jgi:hypothetical protein
MIAFYDFIPQRQSKREYENIHELVSRVNRWIEQHQVDVLNIETMLVSNLPEDTAESRWVRSDLSVSITLSTYQFVRVWYRQDAGPEEAYTGQTRRLHTAYSGAQKD